jgi:hypothetical protein
MTQTKEVQTMKDVATAPVRVDPIDMMSQAIAKGFDMPQLEKMMELHERHEKNEAKRAFNMARAEFKTNPPKVLHDKTNKQYDSTYSSLANLVNTVNTAMAPHGLTAEWQFTQSDKSATVTCVLTHALGHSEAVTLTGPMDTSGAKNPLQQLKSTLTYLKLATFEAVTGIASVAGNLDDDGNASGGRDVEYITEDQAEIILDLVKKSESNWPVFLNYFGIIELEKMPAKRYNEAALLLRRKIKDKTS